MVVMVVAEEEEEEETRGEGGDTISALVLLKFGGGGTAAAAVVVITEPGVAGGQPTEQIRPRQRGHERDRQVVHQPGTYIHYSDHTAGDGWRAGR